MRHTIGVVGDNTIDIYPRRQMSSFVGGNAANVAVQLASHGHDAKYFGAVGPDNDGDRIRAALAARGVNVDSLHTREGETSTTYIDIDDSGDRHFDVENFGVCADYFPDQRDLDALSGCTAVHIGMLPNAGNLRQALAGQGLLVTQDCSVAAGFDGLSVAFCSRDADGRDAQQVAVEAVDSGAQLAVVTCGKDGSIAFDGSTWWSREIAPVTAADTTGAGDSYIAGFVAGRLSGAGIAECMRLGSDWATATCHHVGGWRQHPLTYYVPSSSAGGFADADRRSRDQDSPSSS